MNLEQYAAQAAQQPQYTQQAQEVQTVAQLAATLDAEKLSSLTAQMQEAIDRGASPAAMLTEITGAVFGTSSRQAAAVAAIIDADRHPGGHEWAIADIRQRRKLLKQQAKQVEAQAKSIADELAKLDEAERELTADKADAAALDAALLDTLTICKTLDPQQPDILKQIEAVFERHHSQPAAMGLLYGCMEELARSWYSAGGLDLVQQQQFCDLKDRIAAAIKT